MSNKYLSPERSVLLKERLRQLSENLSKASNTSQFQTQEQLLTESIRILTKFYTDLTEPIFDYKLVSSNDLPGPDFYNEVFQQILDDLIIVFKELENIETLSLTNFNFMSTEGNRLFARLKNVFSKLGDYLLYSTHPTKDVTFFKDSFNNLTKIELNSALLNKDECDVNQEEGIVTLSVDKENTVLVRVTQTPVINLDSNGTIGNNQELNVQYNGDIKTILDNNADTWVEYERVIEVLEDSGEELILDFTINLGEELVINHIRINPNNFGTKNAINIATIETSLDGEVYTNVKDDIPVGDFVIEDEENIFILSPSTSKFSGQGIYTFTPRKVKYIHFIFKQNEPYTIETSAGTKLRYAIGIRDIDIFGLVFESEGEVISKPFTSQEEIVKVLLETNQNPSEHSELAAIDYFVSPNDGQNWYPIQSKSFTGKSGEVSLVPEIINFNNFKEGSITTNVPVKSIRLKSVFSRNDDSFDSETAVLHKKIGSRSELHSVPDFSPFTFELEENPVEGTLVVIDPVFGSRGLSEAPYIVKDYDSIKMHLPFYFPFVTLPRPFKKIGTGSSPVVYHVEPVPASEWLHVTVNGEEWDQADRLLSDYTASGSDWSTGTEYRKYSFDPIRGILDFGTGLNTMLPPDGSSIGIYMDSEILFPSETENNHVAKLEFKTSNNKDAFIIKKYNPIERTTELFTKNATIIRLQNNNITSVTGIEDELEVGNKKDFVNGKDELASASDWSIDIETGVIYLKTPTTATQDISVVYEHQKIETLSKDDWEWDGSGLARGSIKIKESGWETFEQKELDLPVTTNLTVLDLAHLNVVKGTLQLDLSGASDIDEADDPFIKEVLFANGVTELGAQVRKKKEKISILTPSGGIATFTLRENIINSDVYAIIFSDISIFIEEQATLSLTSVGDYYVEKNPVIETYGTVSVKVASSVSRPGTISYYYTNPNYVDNGLYSVNYKHGIIYTQRGMQNTWTLKATYGYTDYKAEYRIARELDSQFYEVDIVNNIVSIKDEEILKRQNFPGVVGSFYQVNYDYIEEVKEGITELKPFFTPVLKDYNLRVITKDKLI